MNRKSPLRYMNPRLRALGLLAVACLALLIGGREPRAQVADCDEISRAPGDKIVMDSVKGLSGPASGIAKLRLERALDMKLGELNQDLQRFVQFVFCDARWPGSATPFDAAHSELLNGYGVMVEVWGELSGDDALLYFAVIPVRHYEYFKAAATTLKGYEIAQYRFTQGAADPDIRTKLFGGAGELRALAMLALGLTYSKRAQTEPDGGRKTGYYDTSRAFFCLAKSLLDQVKPTASNIGLNLAEWQVLVAYAAQSAQAIAQQARSDLRYKGIMKQLPPERLNDCEKPP